MIGADHDDVVDHDGRRPPAVAVDRAVVVALPEIDRSPVAEVRPALPRPRVERHQMRADDGNDALVRTGLRPGAGLVPPVRHAPHRAAGRPAARALRRVVEPDHLARRRIERRDRSEAGADVQPAANHERRVLRPRRRPHGIPLPHGIGNGRLPPRDAQVGRVAAVDLVQRRILAGGLVGRVGGPLPGRRAGLGMGAGQRPPPTREASGDDRQRGGVSGRQHGRAPSTLHGRSGEAWQPVARARRTPHSTQGWAVRGSRRAGARLQGSAPVGCTHALRPANGSPGRLPHTSARFACRVPPVSPGVGGIAFSRRPGVRRSALTFNVRGAESVSDPDRHPYTKRGRRPGAVPCNPPDPAGTETRSRAGRRTWPAGPA